MLRRMLVAALIAATIAATAATPAAAHGWRWRHCRYASQDGRPSMSVGEVERTIRCAVAHWPVPEGVQHALYIADRESHDWPGATNTSSQACGVFQHLPGYWPGRLATFRRAHPWYRLSDDCHGGRVNVLVTIWMAHLHGWGPWGG